jgi:Flp pilus assembly protein TadD
MPKALRFANRLALAALLLGSSAIGAEAGWFDLGSKEGAIKDPKPAAAGPAMNLEDSIHQAQELRLAGSYAEAIKNLSQLMMVASDDPRVVSEYGKTLASMGRAQDAVNFLTRAQQLQPGDWTIYSALGVAYDQLGNQKDAQSAYERALQLKPGEPSVLSNYALSRMLAKDPVMAQKLAARAEIAGGTSDPKIARNIVMIRSMVPEAPDAAFAVNTPAPSPVPHVMGAAPQAAPRVPVAVNAMPQQSAPFVQLPVANNSPQFSPVNAGPIEATPQMAQGAVAQGVVMQRVPEDPLAGPVQAKPAATHAPRPLQPKMAKGSANDMSTVRAEAPKPAPAQPQAAPGVQSAASQADDLQARAEALARQMVNKPAAIAAAKAEANKPETNKGAKTAEARPASVSKDLAPKALAPVKAAEGKSAPAPHVLPPAPVKAATAPAKDAPKAVAAKPKDSIPGLRMSANAY